MQWLSKLWPKQNMKGVGEGSIQVGTVGGDLSHSQSTLNQTIYNTIYVVAAEKPAANESRPATPEQLEVLRIMRTSPAANALAEAFMQKHFQTIRVKSLNELECKRTRRWVEVCLERKNECAASKSMTGVTG